MILVLLLIAELILLYFLSRRVTIGLFELFLLIFRARPVAVAIILILEFPGTVIHELSHLFTAEILGVRTGKLTLEPESIRGKEIQSGSVMIAQTDPFRRYAIGLAPIFSGIIILTAIAYFLPNLMTSVFSSGTAVFQNPDFYWLLLIGYCLFAVSNTMFSSPQDLIGFIPFCIVVVIFVVGLYLIGIRIVLTGLILTEVTIILTSLVRSLGVVLAVNAVLFIFSMLTKQLITKIFRVKIVQKK